jgi:hypothetical protein
MRWLRTLMIAVFLIGSWQVPAAHAARMADSHLDSVAKADEPSLPPCHSAQEQAGRGQPPAAVETSAHGDDDCCDTGHCDCAHASPATPVVVGAVELALFATPPLTPKFAMLQAAALDIPLRPPAR